MASHSHKGKSAPEKERRTREEASSRRADGLDLTTPLENVSQYLKTVRFRKRTFGGVDEQDVWKKINELNALYEKAIDAEHARCNAYIEQYRDACTNALARQRAQYDLEYAAQYYGGEADEQ